MLAQVIAEAKKKKQEELAKQKAAEEAKKRESYKKIGTVILDEED